RRRGRRRIAPAEGRPSFASFFEGRATCQELPHMIETLARLGPARGVVLGREALGLGTLEGGTLGRDIWRSKVLRPSRSRRVLDAGAFILRLEDFDLAQKIRDKRFAARVTG